MIESCFTDEFSNVWNRLHMASASSNAKERLAKLMHFLKREVDKRITLAEAGFGFEKKYHRNFRKEERLHRCC